MPGSDFPDFFTVHSYDSNNAYHATQALDNSEFDPEIAGRKAEQRKSVPPRVECVQTVIANVAALAMWVLAAIPGASQMVYFYGIFRRQTDEALKKQPVAVAPFAAPSVNSQQGALEQQPQITASDLVTGAAAAQSALEPEAANAQVVSDKCTESSAAVYISVERKLSIESLELALGLALSPTFDAEKDAAAIWMHLDDFCVRRSQINNLATDEKFKDLITADSQKMRDLVRPKAAQNFLHACINGLQKSLRAHALESKRKEKIQSMLTMITSLKALPEQEISISSS